ncbi:hypothetical protein [Pseudobacteriovorax antillogorgiicola]|uniref:Beta-barrel porin-2, OmpL-like. bbp2 n=1 Tax=Pseudobacteriovorax antillogorgiicola TaxID=1513793 RepID=A0A1Y6BVR1_9BACT|nr:hypothetical protein [Pseudobacteriovorax antillogorgiicola]TCS52308.1 hypothetical protein EDD56_10952 [Pseudobacteriovorax antillogorgiicola]SMF30297.1 hypothetical protein SAMN06296036_109161 [Pseudobacteriovorax antillogorgiicola]
MKNKILGLALLGAASPSLAAGPWKFTPHIYARGGITLDSDFSRSRTTAYGNEWNLGPWNQESNLFSDPLTEITLDAEYGEQFKFTYGVEVADNNRNYESNGFTRTPVNERLAYLTYYFGDNSIWFGSRPYRSEAEYLTRAFNFDNLDLYGGGIRFERLGPINLEFAYGTFENSFTNEDNSADFQDNVNVVINKVEFPLSNGMIKTNLELQQTMRTSSATTNVEDRTHGYLAGISYQRWGDTVLGGGLYNQFLAHYSKGYVTRGGMGTVFNQFDPDFAAKKYLVQWNGDWKSGSVGLYWSAIAQQHMGKDPSETLSDDEMKWAFADLIVRPQMAITSNLTGGVEYARRSVLEEGDAIRQNFAWAENTGTTRWAGLLNYNMDNATFNNPVITLAVGEVIKDKETQFFSTKTAKSTHFVRLNYEININ